MTIMSPVFGEGRRFRYVTDDEDRKKRLDELVCRKKLSSATWADFEDD